MDTLAIFGLQLTYSLVVWGLIARWIFSPRLKPLALNQALFWLLLPHLFRHVGLSFLVPGVGGEGLSDAFVFTTAFGDLAAAMLALASIFALRANKSWALSLVWVFNIVGTIDLVKALSNADQVPLLGAAWYIPTMFVPLLLVTHMMVFARLIGKKNVPVNAS